MVTGLKKYFPMLQSRKEMLAEVESKEELSVTFHSWSDEQQKEFLDFCTGARGVKLLYDGFFKEIMNPDAAPERLEELLSLILEQQVKILKILPNDSARIAEESSLLIMDIVVELSDGSIANVEVQKIGYAFPGQRSACYSADLLLRQYKRVKGERKERKERFSYKDIKKVYTIVLIEKSTKSFHEFSGTYLHRFQQKSDTGLELDLLQEYVFIALDNFKNIQHNKGIGNKLEAWLTFLSMDTPEDIIRLIEEYPQYRKLYEEVYTMCRNMERVMELFSKELLELDKNTVQYMIDEMQDEIDAQKRELAETNKELAETNQKLAEKDQVLEQQMQENEQQRNEIEFLKKQLEELKK